MALPTLQQHQQLISQEPSSCSWLKDNNSNNNSTDNNRHHSSAPPPQGVCATTRTGPREPRSPFHDPAAHHRPEYQPTTPQHHHHHHSAATATSTFFAGGAARAPTATDDASGYSGDGPLSFPAPKFSSALKIAEADGSFTLVSQTTRRRWSVVDSSRDCQFGEVLRAVELTEEDAVPSAYFAIKELSRKKLRKMRGRTHEDPLKEVAALQYLAGEGHPNVLSCTEALWDKDNIYIVTPFCGGGEVFDAMADRGQFEEVEARPLFRQALAGLLHLKRHGVCHRDVSLENLLLAEGGVVKLIDFGLALRIPQTADGEARPLPPQGPCGKRFYMSPEVLTSSSGYDGFAVDVWACGVMLFAMLTGVPPFDLALPSQDQRCQIIAVEEKLVELLSAWGRSLSTEATDLIQSCLVLAPERRPSLETLLEHPWVNA